MKTLIMYIIGLGFVLLTMQHTFAQSPQGLNYQAVAHDASGNVLANKTLEVKVGIHNFTTSALDYEELHVVETDEFGLFALIVGNGEALQGSFTQLDWGSNSYGIAVHLDVGNGFKDLGVNILQSIPYAFYADKAGSVDNVFLRDLEDVNVADLQEGYVLTWDGAAWNANEIPIEELTLNYEEIKISTGAGLEGGGTFTGEIPTEIRLDAAIDEPIWNANRMQGRVIVDADPNEGDVMKWNGQEWAPQPDEKAAEGGGTGDIEAVVVGTGLTGGGTSGEVTLEATHQEPIWNANLLQGRVLVDADPNQGDVLKWDGKQWLPQSDEIGSGEGSGDISAVNAGAGLKGGGTAGDVTLEADTKAPLWNAVQVRGWDIAEKDPVQGNVLKFDGKQWLPAPDEQGSEGGAGDIEAVNAGTGLSGGGESGEVTLEAENDEPIWNAEKLQGRNVGNTAPETGEVLKWNGSQWVPGADNEGTAGSGDIESVIAGTGLSGGGTSGEVTLNAQNNDPLWNAGKIQGRNVTTQQPDAGQILKWNGNQWNVDADDNGPWSLVGDVAVYSKGSVGINTSNMIGRSNLTMLSTFTNGYGGMQVAMNAPSGVPRPDLKPFYGYAIDGVPLSWTYYDNLSNQWRVYNGGDRLAVRSNGQVGIGTTNPQFDLHVNGTAGKPGGGSWSNASDKRLKTDITNFTQGLAIVQKVRPVHFRYNGKLGYATDEAYVGVIAQELQAIAPFMVSEFTGEDGETYLNVDPSAFDFILINAIKEQQELIMQLQAQVDAQRQKIFQLQEYANNMNVLAEKITALESLLLYQKTIPVIETSSE